MENVEKIEHQELIEEYNSLFVFYDQSVDVKKQWLKSGDFFQKVTMYDESYVEVGSLGSTTLINSI